MKITDIRMRAIKNSSAKNVIAYLDLTFDDQLVVHDIKLINGEKGVFVAMPSKLMPSGEFKDIIHPLNNSFREMITRVAIEKYEEIEDEKLSR